MAQQNEQADGVLVSLAPAIPTESLDRFAITVELPRHLVGDAEFQADIFRLGAVRDELAFSIGSRHDFAERSSPAFSLPSQTITPGLYKLSSFILRATGIPPAEPGRQLLTRPLHFRVYDQADSGKNVEVEAAEAYEARHKLVSRPHVTHGVAALATPLVFTGFVVCSGALLHSQQNAPGLSIIPFGDGLSYEGIREATNQFAAMLNFTIESDTRIARDFAAQTPQTAIVYHKILAASPQVALDYVSQHSADVVTVLGLERGFRPSPFATFVWDGRSYTGHFHYGRYRGNLVAPFSPGQTGEWIERYLPKFSSPKARLLLETYAQATAEEDYAFSHLRFWALLELIATDTVTSDTQNIMDAYGQIILDPTGRAVRTQGAAAKVYKYIFDSGQGSASISYEENGHQIQLQIEASTPMPPRSGVENLSLWDVIGAMYEVRNSVAHSGAFTANNSGSASRRLQLASRFYRHRSDLLRSQLRSMAWTAVLRELQTL